MRIGKLLAAVTGSLILLGGAAMTTGGAVALAVTDGEGWVTIPTARVVTETAAVVGPDISIDLDDAIDEQTFISFGEIPARVDVTGRDGGSVFVGIGPASDVEAYVEGTAHARADFFDDDVDLWTRAGTGAIERPADQDFWVAAATDGALDWDVQSGDWSVVVANADGSPGIDVAITGSAQIPFVEAIAIGLLVFGVLAIVGGATMLYFGVRSDPRPASPAPTKPAPAPGPSEPHEPVIVS